MKPSDRPTKCCVICGRPFTWRKKWARAWAEITTCSDRCRDTRRRLKVGPPPTSD
ncbi:MAG: hypothetical protein RLZZ383_2028 [Pseudomonadota bacterium]|jgi:hypothetical protein